MKRTHTCRDTKPQMVGVNMNTNINVSGNENLTQPSVICLCKRDQKKTDWSEERRAEAGAPSA